MVREFAREGYLVAALARRKDILEETCAGANAAAGAELAFAYPHDVTQFDEIAQLHDQILRDLGGVDIVVYAAGIQPAIGPSEYDFDKDAAMIGVNLLGAMAWFDVVAPRFAQAGKGHIVGISSISGDRGRVAFPGYHTSKGGLNVFLESLRNRLSRHGVTVTTVKPGFVQTRLLANADKAFWVIAPDEAARQIMVAIGEKAQTVYIPHRWRWVSLVIMHIPSFIFRRLSF